MILSNTSAIVTGGAVRIGRAIGHALATAGVNVCVHYGHSADAAQEAVREFTSLGVRATSVQADLQNSLLAAEKVVEHALREFGEVQFLINSAAIFEPGSLAETDEDQWDRHLDINLKAPFFMTREFVRRFAPAAHGAVVNIVDWRGTRPCPGHAAYTLSKAALVAQTRLLAQELGPRIRVNAVAPGAILPSPNETALEFQRRGDRNPLGIVGTPEDVADAVLFLLNSSFITGEILHVTGGEQLVNFSPD